MRSLTFWLLGFVCGFFIGGMVEDAHARYRPVIVKTDGTPAASKWQRWADESKLWLPARITLTNADCPYYPAGHTAGCQVEDRVWVSKAPRHASRFIWLHELGHAVDTYNKGPFDTTTTLALATPRQRELAATMGWKRWAPERFADRFALCGTPNRRETFHRRLIRRTWPLCRKLRTAPVQWAREPDPPMVIEPPADPGVGHSTPVEPQPEPLSEPGPEPGPVPVAP